MHDGKSTLYTVTARDTGPGNRHATLSHQESISGTAYKWNHLRFVLLSSA